ncbi:MAG: hypothetical protein GC151_04555 [Betaproteobacteria bacterium]|nr:hypothetical protein [Betaproteobacteria bacterium]
MHRHLFVVAAAVVAFAFSSIPASGHSEGEGDSRDEFRLLDCDRLPDDAVTTLPAPIDRWARLECVPVGQKLVAAEGWHWRYPGSWTVRPEAPAWAPDASVRLPGAKYFTGITVTELTDGARAATHRRLAEESSLYRSYVETPPERMFRLVAHNNLGHEFEMFVPIEASGRHWGVLCVPGCRPEYGFMMEPAR